ncbi:cytochrome c [Hyphomicrobium sp. CS1GBMeth3]|uniref:c-type cytochrome n=1 Tax=Hyphomicrobium sp. CS1GBMeth3 TaxID=1892845 RepID=UPI0009FA8ACB|nr:cytochrome c [Hyphomicrobium sp. CS1GBMeth3]
MRSHFLTLMLAAAISSGALVGASHSADEPAPAEKAEDAAASAASGAGKKSPIDVVNGAEKGTLKNPFDWKDPEIVKEGHKIYMGLSCNGCHGGGGGGGMCPPLTNETWVYGGDDDTLFRLIVLGSKDLQAAGYARKGQEGVVGPMPPYKDIVDDSDRIWKAVAWIRSVWGGRKEKITW